MYVRHISHVIGTGVPGVLGKTPPGPGENSSRAGDLPRTWGTCLLCCCCLVLCVFVGVWGKNQTQLSLDTN